MSPAYTSRYMDLLEYPVLKGFSGLERVESGVIDPSLISGFAADSLGNYWVNAGTILCTAPGQNQLTVLGGWVTGETSPVSGVNSPYQGNNGTGAATAQQQTLTITGTPTGGTFTLTDPYWGTTSAIAYNASAATVAAALNALPGSGGNAFAASGGALPGTPVTITSQNGALGVQHNLTFGNNALTGGTTPSGSVNNSAAVGQYIIGVLAINTRFFGTTSANQEPVPVLVHNCVFDTTKIQNYAFWSNQLQAALRTCRFE